ncbi:MAG TPA: protein-glutamate O-methyltransferase CheR [Thermodesulfovibrionales bacterium]|nr:protein-glutamate O-methyltransferase CheR [Thermodesulfovibrionales bacterium]
MLEREDIIPLPEDVFRLIRDIIKDYCGLYFDDASRYLLEKRLTRRIRSHHLNDFRDYYRFIRYDKRAEEELSAIMDVLTVNETYFFREQNQRRAFSEEILEELKTVNKGSRALKIWSAGCSTGEEPYTIAMLINEKASFNGWDVEIYGSDINQRVLQSARRGVYRKNSFRTTEPYFLSKYFVEEDGAYRIGDAVKKYVNFSYLNLLDPFKTKFLGKMDVIFCRNVLIYFDNVSRRRVIDNFYDRLVDGGYLLLGHAESLINTTTAFTLKHLKNDMVYQKPPQQGMR